MRFKLKRTYSPKGGVEVPKEERKEEGWIKTPSVVNRDPPGPRPRGVALLGGGKKERRGGELKRSSHQLSRNKREATDLCPGPPREKALGGKWRKGKKKIKKLVAKGNAALVED